MCVQRKRERESETEKKQTRTIKNQEEGKNFLEERNGESDRRGDWSRSLDLINNGMVNHYLRDVGHGCHLSSVTQDRIEYESW